MNKPNKIIIHCADTKPTPNYNTEAIKRWHVGKPPNGSGFNDIGYHFVIEVDGKTLEGRNITKNGAHTRGYNRNSIGICLVGGRPDDNNNLFHQVQFESLVKLLRQLCDHYNITDIKGHNYYNKGKTCPNFNVIDFVNKHYGEIFNE